MMLLRQSGSWVILFLPIFLARSVSADGGRQDELTLDVVTIVAPRMDHAYLQQRPLIVDSLSEQALDAAVVRNTQNLQEKIPGLVFTSSSGVGEPVLRGVGSTVSATGDPGVASFVDGVYQKRVVQSLLDFYDVDRVTVWKGPSATAFGHNVESGAVGIATNDPEPEPDAYADVLYGTRNQRQIRSAVNLPLSATGVAVRFAGTVIRRDGYSRNVYRDEDVDDRDYSSWRGKLGFSPSQNLKIVVGTEQSAQDDTQGMSGQPDPQVGVNGGILAGGTVPADPREVMRNADEYQAIDKHRSHAKILWQVNNVEVLSITARQALQLDTAIDLDGTEADYSSRITREDVQMVSQEVRIRSLADGPFAWETGLYYQRENATQQLDAYLPLLGVSSLARSESVDTTRALFASLSYAFTARWRGRVGARDSHDRVDLRLNQTVTTPMGTQSLPFEDDKDWHTVTPEVGLSFAPNPDRLYYVGVSRGYKAGGCNAYAIQPAYSPEWLTAYETGFKATFPRWLTRLNAALFYYDYRDMQILTLDPGAPAGSLPIIANAARASVRGLDLQTSYRPGDFALTLGATLLDARFEEFDAVDPNNPARNTDHAGEPLPKAPDASWVLGGEYRWRRPEADLRLTISYRYQTKIYFNSFADPAVAQGAYGLMNASLVYENTKQNWFAELYGQNLTNELYAQNVVRVDPVVGTRRIWGDPRSIGIRVGYPL